MSPDVPDDDRTVIRPPAAAPAPGAGGAGSGDELPPTAYATGRTIAYEPTAFAERTVLAGPPPAAAESSNALPVGTYLGEFELTGVVGEGGFGIVYLAFDHSLQRRVALKEYMPSSLASRTAHSQVQVKSARHRETFEAGLKSFINEARLLASFDHSALVKVYRFWEANGTAYMVMPFLEGTTLKDLLRELREPPDEAWLRTLLGPLTEALAVIHAEQCYHRDIAPDNVMRLAATNRWLLLDFGAARRVIGDMTQALTVILKPGYAPVEQYAEIPGMKQGPWTDVYALAAVVYYAIVGRTPPPSVGRLLNDSYVPLVQAAAGRYSERFLAAVDRALVVHPERRTQSIAEFRAEAGIGEMPAFDPYVTKPLPPGTEAAPAAAPAAVAADFAFAPPPAASAASSARAVAREPPAPAPTPAARAATTGGGRTAVLVGAAIAVLAAAVFGAYRMLTPAAAPPVGTGAPAPVAAPAVTAVTAPPAPAPAPVVATPTTFDVAYEFERTVQGQTAGFGVQLAAARSTLRIGRDELAFDVRSERDGYLYVFAFGADGALYQLVPNAVSGAVRVRAGQSFHFPTGNGIVVNASEPPGPGALMVLVSALQRDHSALAPTRDGPFRVFAVGAAGAAGLARAAGPQPALAGRPVCPTVGPCADAYGAAQARIDTVR